MNANVTIDTNKKFHFSFKWGCFVLVLLCVLLLFRKQLWAFVSISISTSWQRISHAKLHVQQITNVGKVLEVYFSPNGEYILTRGQWRYDEKTLEELSPFRLYNKQGGLIADLGEAAAGYITSDGVVLVAPSQDACPRSCLLDFTKSWKLDFWFWDGKFIMSGEGGCGKFPGLVFDSTQSEFATFRGREIGSREEYLWSSDGQKIATLSSPNDEDIDEISFSADGTLIVTVTRTAIFLWDDSGKLLYTLASPNPRYSEPKVYFSPTGGQFVVSSYFGPSEIWTTDGQLVTALKDIQVLSYTPDGHYLIGRKQSEVDYNDDDVLLIDIENGFTSKTLITYKDLYDFRIAANGDYLLTFGCTDGFWWESGFFCFGGTATMWDRDGNHVADLEGLAEVTGAHFVPDSNSIMLTGCDGIVEYSRVFPTSNCVSYLLRLYDYSGNTLAIMPGKVGNFWLSPDGESFVAADRPYASRAKFWRLLP